MEERLAAGKGGYPKGVLMDQEKILARLALYRGLTADEAAQYASLAEEAADWLGQQVRGDVPGGEIGRAHV